MTRKSFIVILILSVIATYVAAFTDVLLSGTVVAGKSGFPFKFGSSSLFGGSTINYLMFFVDIAFWFLIIWVLLKIIRQTLKIIKKN